VTTTAWSRLCVSMLVGKAAPRAEGDDETERTVSVADPAGFIYAFGKLEQAIEELVGAGGVKERLGVATLTLAPIFPDDFPAGHLRDEYADIRQALSWLPRRRGASKGCSRAPSRL
jgi:hypothetical protein